MCPGVWLLIGLVIYFIGGCLTYRCLAAIMPKNNELMEFVMLFCTIFWPIFWPIALLLFFVLSGLILAFHIAKKIGLED